MIKTIKKFQIKLTPFEATKDWAMSTTNNQDLLLMNDPSVDPSEEPVALEFIDYGDGSDLPLENDLCDIALEQQPDDLVNTRLGLNVQGIFYPDTDPTNTDGTYKRMVYTQVKTNFYNDYRDPTKIWGIDTLDFELSKTKRKIDDEIKLFDVPRVIYGDRVIPNTIVMHDNSLDDNISITDDGNGNLVAGTNLFSHHQEIGDHENLFTSGISHYCDDYFNHITGSPPFPLDIISPIFINFTASNVDSQSLAIIYWNNTSSNATDLFLYRSTENTYPVFSFYTTISLNNLSYIDSPLFLNDIYYYKLETLNSIVTSSAFSNIVTASMTQGAYEPWEEYVIGQTGNFNSGSGWTRDWIVVFAGNLVAKEDWERFSLNQSSSFYLDNTIYGWSNPWLVVRNSYDIIEAEESWEPYSIGQTSSFNLGVGWTGPWFLHWVGLEAQENWDEYSVGQTSSFNQGFGWTDGWKIQVSGSI